MLAHVLLAPVQQNGLVCCELVDILSNLNDGARAQLVFAEAPSMGEALQVLAERLTPLATGKGYGVMATLYINATGRMRDWYPVRKVVNTTARQDALVLASAPVSKRRDCLAAVMVVTAPSSRYFRYPIDPDRVP